MSKYALYIYNKNGKANKRCHFLYEDLKIKDIFGGTNRLIENYLIVC